MPKKKKPKQSKTFSPRGYLRKGNARKLPIHECWIPENWEEIKKIPVIVARKHSNGNITFANFLIDLLCTGVKDALYAVNIPEDEYQEIVHKYIELDLNMKICAYQLAHNIIFGAVAYAEEFHIEPHNDFLIAEMILEDDDDLIPIMEIPLGRNDKPFLILHPEDPRNNYYLRQLEKYARTGNFTVVDGDLFEDGIIDEFDDDEDYEFSLENWDSSEWEDFLKTNDTDELTTYDDIIFYIFEKCIYEPEMTSRQLGAAGNTSSYNSKITYEPLDLEKYSQEELDKQTKIYIELHDPLVTINELHKLIKELKRCIQKWPDNPIFHNYLFTAYRISGKTHLAQRESGIIVDRFPDYFFGKLSHAQLLIENGRIEEVPAVFNGNFALPEAFPNRENFHISEFISFNTVMSMYFFEKDDINSAYLYCKMNASMEIPENISLSEPFFNQVDEVILKMVKSLIEDVRVGKLSMNETLALLVTQ